jgi:hypothetical protein
MAWRPFAKNAALRMSVYMNDTRVQPAVKWLYWRGTATDVSLVDAVIATWSNAMTDDQLKEWASKASSEIVKREGAALALSACDRDEPAIEADSNLLGIAIAQAIIEAYQAGVAAASRR